MEKTVHLIILGLVQGVFFRAQTEKKAIQLNLRGWVKNTVNGQVEITAQGNEEDLRKLIAWCKNGAPGQVKKVHEDWPREYKKLANFEILY